MMRRVTKIIIATFIYYIFALSTLLLARSGHVLASVLCCAVSHAVAVPGLFSILVLLFEKLNIIKKINKKILLAILIIVYFIAFLKTCRILY